MKAKRLGCSVSWPFKSKKSKEGEDDELEGKINKASHAEHLKDNLRDAIFALEGGERQTGAIEQLETIHRSLEKASTYDDTFSALSGKVETLSYEIEDIHDALLRYADSFDFDEHALDAMQSRMAAIEKLKRKYGVTVADILFSKVMTETLNKLGMPNSRIAFHIEPMKEISPDGASGIELYFSANTGEAMQPLAKIASGGEVSRIALALKTTGSGQDADKTMIFDEIDVGISGQTGLQVADHIRKLAGRGQIFCITHLPQTAAIADHHFFIYKKEADGRTVTQVRSLSDGEHVLEIARMFAGNDTTKASIEAARQIVQQVKGS